MTTHILLIEDNDHRRVTVLKHLLREGHRVTPCSSVAEAAEILRFVVHKGAAPDIVVISASLERQDNAAFRQSLARRFAEVEWIGFPDGLDIGWLDRQLRQRGAPTVAAAGQVPPPGPARVGRRRAIGLRILVVEADDERRRAMIKRLRCRRDRVTACRSAAEARDELARAADRLLRLDAIVSPVRLPDGNCLSLYVAASRLFPAIRWVVASSPSDLSALGDAGADPGEFALDVTPDEGGHAG